jgi:hypothetical protein
MLAVGIAASTITSVINPMPEIDEYDEKLFLKNQEIDWSYVFLGDNPEVAIASMVINQGIVLVIAVYVIRKWSKKWNLQFEYQN